MKTIIGIDPGASGGITAQYGNGDLVVRKMPETCRDILDLLEELTQQDEKLSDLLCIIENVGGYRPGNSGPAACKFARHCGHLEMALIAAEIPYIYVAPSVWMRAVLKTVPKDKKERKLKIKQDMQRRFPKVKVTLWNADALGMMVYGLEKEATNE